jgi:lipopolysaccharide transport system ATP-binding protein
MIVRLAFAVAAHLNPEILIIDEVLAVGDDEFQKKCLGKMKDVATSGRTVLFVSHNMAAVQSLCTRCVVLKKGSVDFLGEVPAAVHHYLSGSASTGVGTVPGEFDLTQRKNDLPGGALMIRNMRVLNSRGQVTDALQMGESCTLEFEVEGMAEVRSAQFAIMIKAETDQWLCNFNTGMKPAVTPDGRASKETITLRIPRIPFVPGDYWIDLSMAQRGVGRVDFVEHAAQLHVVGADVYGTGYGPKANEGVIFLDGSWTITPSASQTK